MANARRSFLIRISYIVPIFFISAYVCFAPPPIVHEFESIFLHKHARLQSDYNSFLFPFRETQQKRRGFKNKYQLLFFSSTTGPAFLLRSTAPVGVCESIFPLKYQYSCLERSCLRLRLLDRCVNRIFGTHRRRPLLKQNNERRKTKSV